MATETVVEDSGDRVYSVESEAVLVLDIVDCTEKVTALSVRFATLTCIVRKL